MGFFNVNVENIVTEICGDGGFVTWMLKMWIFGKIIIDSENLRIDFVKLAGSDCEKCD